MKHSIIYIVLLLLPGSLFASTPIILCDSQEVAEIRGKFHDYLIDTENRLTISDVSSTAFDKKFISGKDKDIISNNKNPDATYWIRLTILINSETSKPYVVELFDFQIDSLEIYIPELDGTFRVHRGGASFPFEEKYYKHKNFVYNFPYQSGIPKTIYCKIRASHSINIIGLVRSFQIFSNYSTSEYFYLALFYGIIIAMGLYNIFLFIALVDKAYLFYVLYVLSIGLYALSRDGLGFEYLWNNHPELNNYINPVANYLVILFALLYARSFLTTPTILPGMDKGIIALIVARTMVFLSWFSIPHFSYPIYLDIIPLLYIYSAGIVLWTRGYKIARFYILAFTLFFAGFVVSMLQSFGFIDTSPYTVYSLNFGALAEMITLSLALADRIKMLTADKDKAQREIVIQLQEKQLLKDQLNKELQEKVKERTKELDNFIYRSSHDIKGPLKSIIGLSAFGLKDSKDARLSSFFEHILKSSKKLDNIVNDLLEVTTVKESPLTLVKIDLENMIRELIGFVQSYIPNNYVKANIKVEQKNDFYSDEKLLRLILQTLLENSFKYADSQKQASTLDIYGVVNEQGTYLQFRDNGIGMDKISQEKLYDMFYKPDPSTSRSWLYMTKIYVEKLGGSLQLESEVGTGTTFMLRFNSYAPVESNSGSE